LTQTIARLQDHIVTGSINPKTFNLKDVVELGYRLTSVSVKCFGSQPKQ
jgi:hypothetical protein